MGSLGKCTVGSLGLVITLGCRLKCGTCLCKTGNYVLQAEILGYKYKSRLVGKKPAFGLQIQKAYTWAANTKKACTFVQAEFFGSLDRIRTGDLRLERAAS